MYLTAIAETRKLSEGTHLPIQSPLITDNGRAVIMAAFPVLFQSSTLHFRQWSRLPSVFTFEHSQDILLQGGYIWAYISILEKRRLKMTD